MTSLPIAGSSRHAVYTGRTTSWQMVASTCVGAFLLVIMSRGPDAPWGQLAIPLLLIAVGILAMC